jgi:SAM-dependent methyltransferase
MNIMNKIARRYLETSLRLLYKKPSHFFRAWLKYLSDYKKYKYMEPGKFGFELTPSYPCLLDKIDSSGNFDSYRYQDSWAFKHLLQFKPDRLIDVGSSTYFAAFAAQITKVVHVDIRLLHTSMPSIEPVRGDITNLPFGDNSVEAISTLSVIEHIGLGRYGDMLDVNGMQKAANELKRVLKKSGMLLVAFPVGLKNIVIFNAHRICTPERAYEMFRGLELVEEKYVLNRRIVEKTAFDHSGRPYAYGCFRFTK